MQRVQVQVPVSAPFVCPECGGRLRPPGRTAGAGRPWLLPAARIAVLVGAIAGSLGIGYSVGRVQPTVHRAVQDAGVKIGAASAALGLSGKTAPPKPAAPAPRASPGPTLAAAPQPVFVGERPYPMREITTDITNPPYRLAREAKFGQVTLDCGLEAVLTHPACKITDIRGADAFSAAAIAWLQSLSVQYAPSNRTGTPTLLDHRWRITFQDFSGTTNPEAAH